MNPVRATTARLARRSWGLWFGLILTVVTLGLLVRFGVAGPIGDFLGGIAYTVLISILVYPLVSLFLRLRMPARPGPWRNRHWIAAAVALSFSVSIEFLQLSRVPQQLAEVFPPARLVLGTSFAPLDLVAYGVGALLTGLVAALAAAHGRRTQIRIIENRCDKSRRSEIRRS